MMCIEVIKTNKGFIKEGTEEKVIDNYEQATKYYNLNNYCKNRIENVLSVKGFTNIKFLQLGTVKYVDLTADDPKVTTETITEEDLNVLNDYEAKGLIHIINISEEL